jgi:hypothetical protein
MMRPTLALARLAVFLDRKHEETPARISRASRNCIDKKDKKTTAGLNPPTPISLGRLGLARGSVKELGWKDRAKNAPPRRQIAKRMRTFNVQLPTLNIEL